MVPTASCVSFIMAAQTAVPPQAPCRVRVGAVSSEEMTPYCVILDTSGAKAHLVVAYFVESHPDQQCLLTRSFWTGHRLLQVATTDTHYEIHLAWKPNWRLLVHFDAGHTVVFLLKPTPSCHSASQNNAATRKRHGMLAFHLSTSVQIGFNAPQLGVYVERQLEQGSWAQSPSQLDQNGDHTGVRWCLTPFRNAR